MPELPEVETSRRGISPHIKGQKLKSITVRNIKLRWPVPVAALKQCEGEVLNDVGRRGKYIQLRFSTGYMLLHLGMSGSLRIVDKSLSAEKHDHIDCEFDNGKVLRLNDPRRFGCWLWVEGFEEHKLLQKLGPEPLSGNFSEEYFYQASRGKKQAVKQWIMDSHLVVGVGNIYAAESLFKAGINPKKPAGKISKKRLMILFSYIKEILAAAIEQGGTTLKDFVGSDGKPGYFKQELMVYGREGEQCYRCDSTIKNIKLGQRSSFYCPKCQKN